MPDSKQLGAIPQPQFQTQAELDSQFATVAAKNQQMLARTSTAPQSKFQTQGELDKQFAGVAAKNKQMLARTNSAAPKVPSTTTTTPQTEAPQFDITSLRALTYHDANKVQRTKDYTAAYSSGDPSLFTDKGLKAAATKGHVNNFLTSPEFLSMKPEHQIMGLHMLYDKWVAPALQDQGVKPVTFEEWAAGVMPQADKPKGSFSQTFKTAATSALGDDVNLVANVIQKVFGQTTPEGTSAKAAERAHRYSRELKGVGNRMKAVSTSYLTQFDVSNSGSTWLANTAGMLVGQAPLFVAAEYAGGAGVEAAAEAVGSDIFMGASAGKLAPRITTLAERANMGGKGTETAIHALSAGGIQYGLDRGYGKSKAESAEDAAATAILGGVLGSIFHGTAKVYNSGLKDLLIKTMKRGAQKAGVGGEAMINSVADATPKLLGEGEVISPEKGAAAEGKKPVTVEGERGMREDEKIVAHYNSIVLPESKANWPQTLVNDDDPDFIRAVQHEHEMREYWARKIFPDLIEHPTGDTRALPPDLKTSTPKYGLYNVNFEDPRDLALYTIGDTGKSKAHTKFLAYLQKQFPEDTGADIAAKARFVRNRIKNTVPDGDTITLKDTSGYKPKTPRKVWDKIGDAKRARIITLMGHMQKAGAHVEALANPRVVAAKINKDLKDMEQTNPTLLAHMRAMEEEHKISPEVAGVRAQASVETAGLGINEIQQALEEVFSDEEFESMDYEPKEGEFASHGTRYKVSYKRNYGPSVAALADKKETSASDFISGTIKYLEKSDHTKSGHLYFESPKMHLLHLAYNADKVPKEIVDRAKAILKKDFELKTIGRQKYEAGWLNYHVEAMRDAGHIYGGDNPGKIFRSTGLKMLRYGTKTQGKLTPELAAQFVKNIDARIRKINPRLATSLKGWYGAMSQYIKQSSKPEQASKLLDLMRHVEEQLGEI